LRESTTNGHLNPSLTRSIVAHMRHALDSNGQRISANEAVLRNERRGTCEECKRPLRLHESKKIANHFEHLSRTRKCTREY
jgi:competence CoiA-like predicted nuclease